MVTVNPSLSGITSSKSADDGNSGSCSWGRPASTFRDDTTLIYSSELSKSEEMTFFRNVGARTTGAGPFGNDVDVSACPDSPVGLGRKGMTRKQDEGIYRYDRLLWTCPLVEDSKQKTIDSWSRWIRLLAPFAFIQSRAGPVGLHNDEGVEGGTKKSSRYLHYKTNKTDKRENSKEKSGLSMTERTKRYGRRLFFLNNGNFELA